MDRWALQGLGLLGAFLPSPLSTLVNQGVGLVSEWLPAAPICPTGDPVFEVLARTTRVLMGALTTGYFNVSVLGLENIPRSGATIVAGNHPSLIDGLLLFQAMPRAVRFVIAEDFARHPLLHYVSESMGYLPIHHHAVHAAEAALARGDLLGLFPEGWVWDRGTVREWQPGAAILALHSGAPIIPLGIAGSDIAYPGATLLPLPAPIALSFGPPLRFPTVAAGDLQDADLEHVMHELREAIGDQVERARHQVETSVDVRPPWLIAAAAVLLLPMVVVFTLTTPGLD